MALIVPLLCSVALVYGLISSDLCSKVLYVRLFRDVTEIKKEKKKTQNRSLVEKIRLKYYIISNIIYIYISIYSSV